MPIELTEQEFLKLVNERLNKAKNVGNKQMYDEHVVLLNFYKEYKKHGYVMKYYLADDSSLFLVPYSKEEIRLFEKKYRECGIW